MIRQLWAGDEVTHRGRITLSEARLWTRPARAPLLVGAAVTPETAGWVGEWADALITVAQEPERLDRIVDAFRASGGEQKPMFLQVHLATGETDDAARASAFEQWRENMQDNRIMTELRHPEQVTATKGRGSRPAVHGLRPRQQTAASPPRSTRTTPSGGRSGTFSGST